MTTDRSATVMMPQLLQLVECHCHPLACRSDDGGDLIVREPALDDETVAVTPAVRLGEDHQELGQPFDHRAGAEHLHQGRIALALGGHEASIRHSANEGCVSISPRMAQPAGR